MFFGLLLKYFMKFLNFKQISSLLNISKNKSIFQWEVKHIQCGSGGEYVNGEFQNLCETKGISFRLSRPHTSPQNGKAERKFCSTNNIIRTLLIHASLHCPFSILLHK